MHLSLCSFLCFSLGFGFTLLGFFVPCIGIIVAHFFAILIASHQYLVDDIVGIFIECQKLSVLIRLLGNSFN